MVKWKQGANQDKDPVQDHLAPVSYPDNSKAIIDFVTQLAQIRHIKINPFL